MPTKRYMYLKFFLTFPTSTPVFFIRVKLRLLAHNRSFLANQKARNAIVGAENLLSCVISINKCLGLSNIHELIQPVTGFVPFRTTCESCRSLNTVLQVE